MQKTQFSKLHILLAEDDPVDRELFAAAITETGIQCTVDEVTNGFELIDYLHQSEQLPSIILLDLNMPLKNGREALLEIKKDVKFRNIPVFVLTTSNSSRDAAGIYELGISLFLVKPNDFREMVNMLRCLLGLLKYGI